jgi:hypothetical protein
MKRFDREWWTKGQEYIAPDPGANNEAERVTRAIGKTATATGLSIAGARSLPNQLLALRHRSQKRQLLEAPLAPA